MSVFNVSNWLALSALVRMALVRYEVCRSDWRFDVNVGEPPVHSDDAEDMWFVL